MELSLFHIGPVNNMDAEQTENTEKFINNLVHTVIATVNADGTPRLSNLNNLPNQTLKRLLFATDSQSTKISNIRLNPYCELMYTDGNSQVILTGHTTLLEDKENKKALWNDQMYNYFPEGPESGHFCLIEFTPVVTRIMLAATPEMETSHVESFPVAGIAIRTTNKNGQSQKDIAMLWQKFWSENIINQISNRINNDIYCVYTEFEGDFTQPYTCLIGCRVNTSENIPEKMKLVNIEEGNYNRLTAHGKLNDGIVVKEWEKVWSSGMKRRYGTDYEYYNASNTVNPDEAEVEIYVGTR